ncbi:hypothetical protein [Methylocapsa aurea]|uniref:hypothetical protein n=1 Tax=Methylocapsa aurea TaxID=663610 RepID=UPI000565803F|nr:hypothetical protein [Methylocapsa aurea]
MAYYQRALFAILIATVAPSYSWAGEHIFANFGQTITLNGTIENDNTNNADPFTLQVFSAGNECLRIAVLNQGANDLEATLVGPSGVVFQDDDGNGSLRPLIKAITQPANAQGFNNGRGWYALSISTFDGRPVHGDFSFQIARLASTDAQCAAPTGPRVFAATSSATKASQQVQSGESTFSGGTGK